MNLQLDTRLTSAELNYLYGMYSGDTLSVCVSKYFLQHIEDPKTKKIVEHTLDLAQQHIATIEDIFRKEALPIPQGFTESDVHLGAKRLFSDDFCLYYVKQMVTFGLSTFATSLPFITRNDILSFNNKCLISSIELNDETTHVMLEKGKALIPPYIPYPKEIEFVHKQSFILEILGKRPLIASEVTSLYSSVITNNIGHCIGTAFAQVAESQEIRDYLNRGCDISLKHIDIFPKYLNKH